MPSPVTRRPTAANRLGIDYAAEAARFPVDPALAGLPIIDAHAHINGTEAARLYWEAAEAYGVRLTYSMTWWDQVEGVRNTLGDKVRFIAFPKLQQMKDEAHLPGMGLVRQVEQFHAVGARMLKFWVGPRIVDFIEDGDPEILARLDSPPRIEAMERAVELDMMFMVHVADPDTWFGTMYKDAGRYGTKAAQYDALHRVIERFPDRPWIAAHMGGWPEDLGFLTDLLDRHPQLYLDTSAAKWMIRELSKHPRPDFLAFLERFRDRILFGSDIVTLDEHLVREPGENPMHDKAGSPEEAYDLYAGRYWALRTMFETDHEGESPIADPDLAMVDPDGHDDMSAPTLRGHRVPTDLLRAIYHDNAARLLDAWYGPSV